MGRSRLLLAGLHAAAAAAVVIAVVLQLDRPMAPPLSSPAEAERFFSEAFLRRVDAYRTPRYAASLAALALHVLVPAWWALSAAGRRSAARVAGRIGAHRPLRAATVVALAVVVSVDLAILPLAFWSGFLHEGQYGFRTQGLGGWARDWLLGHAPLWLGVAALTGPILAVVRRAPRAWPPVLGLSAGVLAAVLTILAPVLLEPLWLRTAPLEPGPVRSEVERVLARADAPVQRILVGDASRRSTKGNAYVSGLGATRRVVLYDTLLAQASPEEIGVVLAHELAHDRHGDIWRGVWQGVAGGVLLAYALAFALRRAVASGRVTGPADVRAVTLALLLAAALTAASLPVQSVLSRRAEAAADWGALELTREPETFASMQRTLAASLLSDPSPPGWVHWLWYSHPSARDRIAMARQWAQRHDVPFRPAPVEPEP